MDADGSKVSLLTDETSDDVLPTWSPDGAHLVFVSVRDGNREVYSLRLDDGALERLTEFPALDGIPARRP